MNLELSQISEVPQALEILRGEVGRVETAVREEGAKAMTATASGSLKAAEEAIAYAKRLHAFISKIDALGKEWQKIEASIAKATPEAREIVRKAGGTHVVTGPLEPKTNFTVTFPDGTVIAEPKANLTLARAIEAIGPARVAALRGAACLRPNGEPLVTRREADLAKYPSAKLSLAGGWFLNTQSSTEAKAKTVKEISKQLKLKLKVKIVPGTFLQEKTVAGEKPAKPVKASKPDFPYAVGKVVQAVFPVLQTDARMKAESVSMLKAEASSARFKTGGWAVLKPNTGNVEEIKDSSGIKRYYGKLPLSFFGRKYWLTSQFQPHGIGPVLAWLEEIGLKKGEVLDICNRRWKSAQGMLFEGMK